MSKQNQKINAALKPITDRVLKYSNLRASALKACSAFIERLAKLRIPLKAKVEPQLRSAESLEKEIIALLEKQKAHFVQPKSLEMHGVRFGFRAQDDVLCRIDGQELTDEWLVAEIRRVDSSKSGYLNVIIKPDLVALKGLMPEQLERFGLKLKELDDKPFVTIKDGLDKLAKHIGIGVAS